MTDEEIFAIFDVIHRHGKLDAAKGEIWERLHFRPPHRTTVAAVFNVGVEFFRRDPNGSKVLATQEAEEIAIIAGYGVQKPRVVELHRLYQLWKIRREQEKEKRNVDAVLSTLGERSRKVWFLRLQHWSEEEIAKKLGGPLRDIELDIEEVRKESASKTQKESELDQDPSMLNLPAWVNQAQQEHLEGREQRDEFEGIDVITYPRGAGIRQQLGFFQGSFSDIDPQYGSFWHPLDKDVMTQLHGHLPDETFWSQLEKFKEIHEQCVSLLDAAYKRFTSAGKKLAPLQLPGGPVPDAYITSSWARQVLVRALSRKLGLKEPGEYHHQNLPDGRFALENDGRLIYTGSDDVTPEKRHRQLVKNFIKSEKFKQMLTLMKQLQDWRQQILARINQCLRKREYSFNYCFDCPAEQARKILASKGNN